MSFILDALRKSESERQQDAAPSISRIPSAVPQHGLPPWAIATMAALGIGVVVLAGAWIRTVNGPRVDSTVTTAAGTGGEPTGADGAVAPDGGSANGGLGARPPSGSLVGRRVEPLPIPAQSATSFSGSLTAQTPAGSTAGERDASSLGAAVGAADRSPASAPQRSTASGSPLASARVSSLAVAAREASVAPDAGRSTSAAPTREALPPVQGLPAPYHSVAPSLGLPELSLELLAYSEDPAERFVFVNGKRYVIGDTLPGGSRVIAINARGAVLLAGDRQLQLEQR